MDVSVVIPVCNEEGNIASLINEISVALGDNYSFETIVVDDGSSDKTLGVLASEQAAHPELRVLKHSQNVGQSTAIHNGVKAARASLIATLDGDGQNDPADIPALFAALDTLSGNRPGVICGWREKRHDSWLRKFSSRVANGVRSGLLGDSTPDTGCGLKLFPRDLFLELPYFNHMHRFLPALFQSRGAQVISVPVGHRPREHGTSKYGLHNRLWVGIIDLFGVMWLKARTRRTSVTED